jgi:hypothetical protein
MDHESDRAIKVIEEDVVCISITFEKRYLLLESRRACAGWMRNTKADVDNCYHVVWRGWYVTKGVWDRILPELVVNGAWEILCYFLLAAVFPVSAPVRLLARPGASR